MGEERDRVSLIVELDDMHCGEIDQAYLAGQISSTNLQPAPKFTMTGRSFGIKA